MSETVMWQPAVHQLVVTSMGLAVVEDIKAVKYGDLYHLRFHVRLVEVEPGEPKEAIFGAAELGPLFLEKSPGVYHR